VPSFERYPFSIPAVRHLTSLPLHPQVTYFIGENGTGKSTLLEAVAVVEGFNAEGGSRSFNFATRESHSDLCKAIRLKRGSGGVRRGEGYFFRAESFFIVATEIERLDEEGGGPRIIAGYGGKSLHEQSHGEAFFSLITNRFQGNGLYLLDEPESALSPQRQLSLLAAMHDLLARDSQFIIATHSPIVLAYPHATIYEFSRDGIRQVAYEDTEHYKVTRAFLTRREPMLRQLLGDS
jgi:predicted ATPase